MLIKPVCVFIPVYNWWVPLPLTLANQVCYLLINVASLFPTLGRTYFDLLLNSLFSPGIRDTLAQLSFVCPKLVVFWNFKHIKRMVGHLHVSSTAYPYCKGICKCMHLVEAQLRRDVWWSQCMHNPPSNVSLVIWKRPFNWTNFTQWFITVCCWGWMPSLWTLLCYRIRRL